MDKKPRSSAKNLQVRLGEQAHQTVKELADVRGISLAETIREAIEFYAIAVSYASLKKNLIWEDPITGSKTHVLIPGLNSPGATILPSHLSNNTEH